MQERVGVVEGKQEGMLKTQAMILQRPLNEASILISRETHAKVYWDLFQSIPWSSDNFRQSAATNGTHIYFAPTIGGNYNKYVVSDVRQAGNLVFIGRYHPPAPGKEAVVVPGSRVKEKVPQGVLQQSLDIRIVKPVNIPGREDLNAPAQRRAPSKRPFSRTQNEKWTRPNGHNSTRRYYYA